MLINVVEPHQVAAVWPQVERFIEAAQRRGPTDYELQELRFCCTHDPAWRLLVLEHGRGAAIIRIFNARLHVVSLGGKFERNWSSEFFYWLKGVVLYLELKGITLCGRKGWARKLAPLGFKSIGGGWLEARI